MLINYRIICIWFGPSDCFVIVCLRSMFCRPSLWQLRLSTFIVFLSLLMLIERLNGVDMIVSLSLISSRSLVNEFCLLVEARA